MALTELQRRVCRVLADRRIGSGVATLEAGEASFHAGSIGGAFPVVRSREADVGADE